jgi:hypothetical protein
MDNAQRKILVTADHCHKPLDNRLLTILLYTVRDYYPTNIEF